MARARRGKGRAARARETRFDEDPFVGEPRAYALLDSGRGEKLERFGPFTLVRPAASAVWARRLDEADWRGADARFERRSDGGGRWSYRNKPAATWLLEAGDLSFIIKTTEFGHLGLFPEQQAQWRWIEQQCQALAADEAPPVLNLFAYTGGSSLAAARGGGAVCHVDAARGIVDWARENARRSGLGERPLRWIVDDVGAFVRREQRRGRRYQGLILDPPSFGRGRRGELWKIEDDLVALLETCRPLLSEQPAFVLLSCHTPGFTPRVLDNLLDDLLEGREGRRGSGEMLLEGPATRPLPSGCFARWSSASREKC